MKIVPALSDDMTLDHWGHSRPQSLRSFWPAAGIESSGSYHFEITKEITEFCPSGLTQSSSMVHARNGCSQSSRFLPQARRIVGSGNENALGWALKVTKRPTRRTDDVKTFLMKKFEEGARTGNKAYPVQVAREMKTLRNEDDAEATESGIAFDTLGSLMMDDMGKSSHAIDVSVSNICELVKNKKLDSLN